MHAPLRVSGRMQVVASAVARKDAGAACSRAKAELFRRTVLQEKELHTKKGTSSRDSAARASIRPGHRGGLLAELDTCVAQGDGCVSGPPPTVGESTGSCG